MLMLVSETTATCEACSQKVWKQCASSGGCSLASQSSGLNSHCKHGTTSRVELRVAGVGSCIEPVPRHRQPAHLAVVACNHGARAGAIDAQVHAAGCHALLRLPLRESACSGRSCCAALPAGCMLSSAGCVEEPGTSGVMRLGAYRHVL